MGGGVGQQLHRAQQRWSIHRPKHYPSHPPNRSGEPIPRIDYTPQEMEVWGTALGKLRDLFPQHACKEVSALPELGRGEAGSIDTCLPACSVQQSSASST